MTSYVYNWAKKSQGNTLTAWLDEFILKPGPDLLIECKKSVAK